MYAVEPEQQMTLLKNIDFGNLGTAGAENFRSSFGNVEEYHIDALVFALAIPDAVACLCLMLEKEKKLKRKSKKRLLKSMSQTNKT